MTQTLDMLVKHTAIDGHPTANARIVITADRRATMFGRPNGGPIVTMSTLRDVEWSIDERGALTVTGEGWTWTGVRDGGCGSCNGRFQLRSANPDDYLPTPIGEQP